jgi:tetratricopeptide (TPR) repeat protein
MSTRLARWLICLLLIAAGPALAGERTWRIATTPHYRLLSQLSERETAAWMREFDQFILSTSDVLKMDVRALTPLTVVIFAGDKDFTPYKMMKPNGQTAKVAGQFIGRPTWSMIGMASAFVADESRKTIYHEATHWLMSMDDARQPAWFTEGVAEMFSTFERRGSKVNWAKPIDTHLIILNGAGEMPLAEFLIEPSALFDRDDRTDRFYAQAWAFTHFLMFSGEPARRQLLLKFLETYKTQSGEATVAAVFGPTLKDVERDFHNYVQRRSWNYMVEPVKPAAEPPALQPAPAALVESSLGFLALGAHRLDLARPHAQKAIELDVNAPEGHALQAYLAAEDDDFDQAVAHAEAALKHGSKDSALFLLIGDSYLKGRNSQKPDAKRLRVAMYENAINLSPRRLTTYERLAEALFALENPREEDAKFLSLGLRAFPGEDWLRVGAAVVDYRLGRRDAATTALDNTLRPQSTLDDAQRAFAANVRRTWFAEAMRSEIDVAVNKNDFAGARAVVVRYRERIGTDTEMASFLDEVDAGLELGDLMDRYEVALRAHRRAEARALAEQLLERPNLPASVRKLVEKTSGR